MDAINIVFEHFITFLLWLQGLIVIISSSATAVAYWRVKDDRLWHIVTVATSHCMLALLAITAIEFRMYPLVSLRGFFAFVAFALTDYGLGYIFYKKTLPRLFPKRFAKD